MQRKSGKKSSFFPGGTSCSRRKPYLHCMALIVAMALLTTGCNGSRNETPSGAGTSVQADGSVLGEGSKEFAFTVVDKEGSETHLEIHTDKETVGEALQELELIAGEESEYGLYVKTVNGITADFDTDGVYWAFYVDGEYALTGVDSTPVTAGAAYAFKLE